MKAARRALRDGGAPAPARRATVPQEAPAGRHAFFDQGRQYTGVLHCRDRAWGTPSARLAMPTATPSAGASSRSLPRELPGRMALPLHSEDGQFRAKALLIATGDQLRAVSQIRADVKSHDCHLSALPSSRLRGF
jgi:hypothetical protein